MANSEISDARTSFVLFQISFKISCNIIKLRYGLYYYITFFLLFVTTWKLDNSEGYRYFCLICENIYYIDNML